MTLITTQFSTLPSPSYAVSLVSLKDLSRQGELSLSEKDILQQKNLEESTLSFLAGRLAAHEAMASVGITGEVLVHESTTQRPPPRWPTTISGSIAHTKSGETMLAVAIASQGNDLFGIDIEPLSRKLTDTIGRRILNEKEKKSLSSEAELLKIFCIKEATYKALWPVVKQPMRFQDVTVSLENNIVFIEERLKALLVSYRELYFKQQTYNEMLITLVSSIAV